MEPLMPVLDEEPLRALYELPGGPESVAELLQIFLEDVPQRIAMLRLCLQEGKIQEAGIEAHSLKGGSGNMGLVRLAAVAAQLEHRLRFEGSLDCGALLEQLDQEFPLAAEALKTAFPA